MFIYPPMPGFHKIRDIIKDKIPCKELFFKELFEITGALLPGEPP